MPLRATLRLLAIAFAVIFLPASACHGEGRSTPTSGPSSGAGGATPSQSRDMAGSAGDTNPARQREYAGNVGRSGVTAGALAGKTGAPDAGMLSSEPCARDEDCALTRLIPGECCGGCSQRAVLKASLEQRKRECESVQCPALPCAPPRFMLVPVCRDGRCVAERARSE